MIASPRTARSLPAAGLLAPTLAGGARVEVCLAGCGLAGMIAGYLLAREKRSVMVIDEGPVGGAQGDSETVQLAAVPEASCREIESRHGAEAARSAARRFAAAIDAIEAIVRRERIACEFERLDGYRLVAGETHDELEAEIAAARSAGVKDAEWLAVAPVRGASDAPCVRHPGLATLHPGKLAAGLARSIEHEGGRIHAGVRTRAVETGPVASLLTSVGHRVLADVVVTPAGTSCAAAAHVVGLRVPRGAVTRALYWEGAALRCARLRSQGLRTADVLMVAGRGGEADAAAQFDALEAWARRHFPCAGEIVQRFCGETLRTFDAFAFAGRGAAESVDAGAPIGGTTLTRAILAGMAIRDGVEGSQGSWSDLAPARRATSGSAARELA